MSAMGGLDDARADLEDRPRKPFDVDEARCIEAMAYVFGEAYTFPGRDDNGLWGAFRRDGQPAVSGRWPDDLRRAILADFAAHPVVPR